MSRPDSAANPYDSPADVGVVAEQSSETGKLIYRTIKYVASALLAITVLWLFNIVGFHYFHATENNPLNNPASVVRNANEEVALADGRSIVRYFDNDRLSEVMKRSDTHVEFANSENSDMVEVYAKDRRYLCGIGMPMITIPLIPIKVPRYKRVMVGFGYLPTIPSARPAVPADSGY